MRKQQLTGTTLETLMVMLPSKGAHHVLRNQKGDGFNDLLAMLTKVMESSTVLGSTTVAAYDILKRMKAKL